MTKEEKQLLLKDLCARLPYGFTIHRYSDNRDIVFEPNELDEFAHFLEYSEGEKFKPYLRPMSSMTEEERDEIEEISHGWFYVNEDGEIFPVGQLTDSAEFEDAILPTLELLNKNKFDYRGLIPALALEAPEGMYKID